MQSMSALTSLIWTSGWSVAKTLSLPGACDASLIDAIHTSLQICTEHLADVSGNKPR